MKDNGRTGHPRRGKGESTEGTTVRKVEHTTLNPSHRAWIARKRVPRLPHGKTVHDPPIHQQKKNWHRGGGRGREDPRKGWCFGSKGIPDRFRVRGTRGMKGRGFRSNRDDREEDRRIKIIRERIQGERTTSARRPEEALVSHTELPSSLLAFDVLKRPCFGPFFVARWRLAALRSRSDRTFRVTRSLRNTRRMLLGRPKESRWTQIRTARIRNKSKFLSLPASGNVQPCRTYIRMLRFERNTGMLMFQDRPC